MKDFLGKTIMNTLHQKEITAGKGKQGENCNVTHCQKPKSAKHYNKVMCAWYCYECATKIEAVARRDGQSFYDDL